MLLSIYFCLTYDYSKTTDTSDFAVAAGVNASSVAITSVTVVAALRQLVEGDEDQLEEQEASIMEHAVGDLDGTTSVSQLCCDIL